MNQSIKIIITGLDNIDKLSLGKAIEAKDDNLSIAPKFTSDLSFEGKHSEYQYFMSMEDVFLGYKNNSFLYVSSTNDGISEGVTLDALYNYDIIVTSISDFNKISELSLSKYNFLVIWLDTKYHPQNINDDILETKYLLERLDYTDYMYFLDEDTDKVSDIILDYIHNPEHRKELLEENL